MNKQLDLFGSCLIVDDFKKNNQKKINEILIYCDIIEEVNVTIGAIVRIKDDIMKVKSGMRGCFLAESLLKNKSRWISKENVILIGNSLFDVLKIDDLVLFRNDNSILVKGIIKNFVKKKKGLRKVILMDVADGEILMFLKEQFVKLLDINVGEEYVKRFK